VWISPPYAIAQVRQDLQPYCRVASLAEPIEGFFDLITCIEVLEHMPENEADQAIQNLCRATDAILFSSTPSDFSEPTHVNVRPVVSWLHLFAEQGFAPDLGFDASYVSPHAFLLRRNPLPVDGLALFSERLSLRAELAQAQVEKLRMQGELSRADAENLRVRTELAETDWQLKEIHASPAWRLVAGYRDWLRLQKQRHSGVYRFIESTAPVVPEEGRLDAPNVVEPDTFERRSSDSISDPSASAANTNSGRLHLPGLDSRTGA
jgi:hypothetical protein